MQTFAARRLAEGDQPQGFESFAELARRLDHCLEADVRGRVEVEDQPSRHVGFAGLAVPGMQFEPAALRHGGSQETESLLLFAATLRPSRMA